MGKFGMMPEVAISVSTRTGFAVVSVGAPTCAVIKSPNSL
jgi:hypothetical protein